MALIKEYKGFFGVLLIIIIFGIFAEVSPLVNSQVKLNCEAINNGRIQGKSRAIALTDAFNLLENSSNRLRVEKDKKLIVYLPQIKC